MTSNAQRTQFYVRVPEKVTTTKRGEICRVSYYPNLDDLMNKLMSYAHPGTRTKRPHPLPVKLVTMETTDKNQNVESKYQKNRINKQLKNKKNRFHLGRKCDSTRSKVRNKRHDTETLFYFTLCIRTHQVSHRSGKNFSGSGNILGSQLAALVRNPT